MGQPSNFENEFRRALDAGELTLPDPASGRTAERHQRLMEIARADLQIGPVAEAHTDAVSILHEAGRVEVAGALYGVWAAEDPSCKLELRESDTVPHGFVLSGTKAFCTGASIIDRALVTVRHRDAAYLIDIDLRDQNISFDFDRWRTQAFDATCTAVTTFEDLDVRPSDIVGTPGWYLDRVGFWHGACGPAASWAGGAIGLVDRAIDCAASKPADPHRDAQIGALAALGWQLQAMLQVAGDQIDQQPDDVSAAMRRALMLRHNVERAATAVVDLFGRALGPRPLIEDSLAIRRVSELQLYIRQHHDEHDLESVGREMRRAR